MRSPKQFGKNLEALRKFNGQTLAEQAQEAGVAKSTLQSVRLSGNTTLDTAIRIANGLGLSLDGLAGDGQLPEKMDLTRHLLRSVHWFRGLPEAEQEEVLDHFRRILEVACK